MGKRRLEGIQRTRLRVSANMGERRSEMEWVELEQLSELQRLGSVLPCEMCHVIATAVLLECCRELLWHSGSLLRWGRRCFFLE